MFLYTGHYHHLLVIPFYSLIIIFSSCCFQIPVRTPRRIIWTKKLIYLCSTSNGEDVCYSMAVHISMGSSREWFLAEISKPIHVDTRFVVFLRHSFWSILFSSCRGHVLSEDTYYRTLTKDQILISKRLLAKTNKLPRWGERIFSRGSASTIGFIVEESTCDLKAKIFTTSTININLKSLMVRSTSLSKNKSWIVCVSFLNSRQ